MAGTIVGTRVGASVAGTAVGARVGEDVGGNAVDGRGVVAVGTGTMVGRGTGVARDVLVGCGKRNALTVGKGVAVAAGRVCVAVMKGCGVEVGSEVAVCNPCQ